MRDEQAEAVFSSFEVVLAELRAIRGLLSGARIRTEPLPGETAPMVASGVDTREWWLRKAEIRDAFDAGVAAVKDAVKKLAEDAHPNIREDRVYSGYVDACEDVAAIDVGKLPGRP